MLFKLIIYILIFTIIVRWLGFSFRIFNAFKTARKQQNVKHPKEGEVHITYQPEKDKKIDSAEGEYVKFEELKD